MRFIADCIGPGTTSFGGSILNFHRRDFLKVSAAALAAGLLPIPALAAIHPRQASRKLAFYNTHTGETLDVRYFEQGTYRPDQLERIDQILRDHRTSEIHPIDRHLLDLLFVVKSRIRPHTPFHIISGYRSPATNAMLRRKSPGVARSSFHMKGKAIDIRLPGYSSRRLRDLCIDMKAGGVGYYANSNFVHLDTGPVRHW